MRGRGGHAQLLVIHRNMIAITSITIRTWWYPINGIQFEFQNREDFAAVSL